jgi:acyl dehydratase
MSTITEKYWDDYEVGDEIRTLGRTLMDADIRLFIGATDATHPAHVDAEYCRSHPFQRIVVPGALTLGVIDGLVVRYVVPRMLKIAHYGYDRIRFLGPVYPGDTISMTATVVEKRERNTEFGIVVFDYDVRNQDGQTVVALRDLQMIERRQAA